jgi:hypothetical protein
MNNDTSFDCVHLVSYKEINLLEINYYSLYNSGQPGTWHETLTPEQNDKMDKLIEEVEDAGVTVVHT